MIAPLALMLALGPWSGADLPTATTGTFRYKLTLSGEGGHAVRLTTGPLPKDWIASFCTPRICAPFKTTLVLPPGGTATIEFQLIPPDERTKHPVAAAVYAADGALRATARTR